MQELIFWIIFLTVTFSLLISQSILRVERPILPSPQGTLLETLPDPKKEDPALVLEYENAVVRERLVKLDKRTDLVYGLGKNSGPDLNIAMIREGARQFALQQIILKLEEKKSIILELLEKNITNEIYLTELQNVIGQAFLQLYSGISLEEGALISTFRIWTKTEKQITSYYFLVVFNHDYALSYVLSLYPELAAISYNGKQIPFEALWYTVFQVPEN